MQPHKNEAASVVELHLIPAMREQVEAACAADGVSVDEFIGSAVERLLEQRSNREWMKNRRPPSDEVILAARRLLRRPGSRPPDPGDELPEGYEWPPLD